jgi:hypothetical protein
MGWEGNVESMEDEKYLQYFDQKVLMKETILKARSR